MPCYKTGKNRTYQLNQGITYGNAVSAITASALEKQIADYRNILKSCYQFFTIWAPGSGPE